MKYKEYLKTEHWQNIREWALERADNKCQICKSENKLNVHHNDYSNLGKEKPSDLIVLCEECHQKFHEKLPEPVKQPISEKPLTNPYKAEREFLLSEIREIEKPKTYTISKHWKIDKEAENKVEKAYLKKCIVRLMDLDLTEKIKKNIEKIESTENEGEILRLLRENNEANKMKKFYQDNEWDAIADFSQKYPNETEKLSRLF